MTKGFNNVQIKRHEAAHRQIARAIRERLQRGEIKPGVRLPSTEELAKMWNSSYFTVHTALKALVKEGLLERLHGSGTYVREQRATFASAGIYLGGAVKDHAAFIRHVCEFLEEKLTRDHVAVHTFVESRPRSEYGKVLPALQRAVDLREIQAVISPANHGPQVTALNRLPVPLAMLTTSKLPCRVGYDTQSLFRGAFSRLRAHGCRTVGMITHIRSKTDPHSGWEMAELWEDFEQELTTAGLTTRDEWLLMNRKRNSLAAVPRVGYEAFMELWRRPEKPDGLVVFPDGLVPGVILAMLQLGVRPPDGINCVFHRNKHFDILCPFHITWALSDEEKAADSLIEMVQMQFRGDKISEVKLPYTFAENKGV